MKKVWLYKIVIVFTLIFSIVFLSFSNEKVSASSTETTQSYITIDSIFREDNTIKFTINDDIKIKDITYERVYILNEEKVSDLVNEVKLEKSFGTNEYTFEVEEGTIGVKIWKIKHQIDLDYYKNKFTKGKNVVGDITSKSKKNYLTVTADKLESYEFACKEFDLPWYMWSVGGIQLKLGDYLFNRENCASYTWYFSLDQEIDRIESLSLEYATFTYTEALWGLVESKHDYKTYQVDIDSSMNVYDYKKFVGYANENCHNLSICNNKLYEKGQEYFQHSAFGISDEEGYDYYVQVSLNDLLKENNVLWGAYENHDYLQEVSLIIMSYWFEGEYYDDVLVLDEDTGELIVKADDSPIDKLAKFLESSKKWLNDHLEIIGAVALGILFVLLLPLIIKFLNYIENALNSTNDKLKELTTKEEK